MARNVSILYRSNFGDVVESEQVSIGFCSTWVSIKTGGWTFEVGGWKTAVELRLENLFSFVFTGLTAFLNWDALRLGRETGRGRKETGAWDCGKLLRLEIELPFIFRGLQRFLFVTCCE